MSLAVLSLSLRLSLSLSLSLTHLFFMHLLMHGAQHTMKVINEATMTAATAITV